MLLGDTLFMEYVITFDKLTSRIGFQGDIDNVIVFGEQQFLISQYIMMGSNLLIFVMGIWMIFFLRATKV